MLNPWSAMTLATEARSPAWSLQDTACSTTAHAESQARASEATFIGSSMHRHPQGFQPAVLPWQAAGHNKEGHQAASARLVLMLTSHERTVGLSV